MDTVALIELLRRIANDPEGHLPDVIALACRNAADLLDDYRFAQGD